MTLLPLERSAISTIAAQPTDRFTLSDSKRLRFITVCVFYLNQGIGLGFFGFTIPAWLTENGATLAQIATIVSIAALPWSFKFISGALVDRYTFLPMGRRRIWIIGAQTMLTLCLVAIAILSPSAQEIAVLAAIGFVLNVSVVMQDVGVDALAIDLFDDDERPYAAGAMFGAQTLGAALAIALSGWVLANHNLASAALVLTAIPIVSIAFGIAIKEREGERRLPWGPGEAHHMNLARHATNWREIFTKAFRALIVPGSLLLLPLLLIRSIPGGVAGTYGPTLFTQNAQWSTSDFTNFVAIVGVGLALYTLLFSGKITQILGERRAFLIAVGGACIVSCAFAGLASLWAEIWFLVGFVLITELLAITALMAIIPICMRLCYHSVAGTQFVIYMGITNLGAPIGAYLTTLTAGAGYDQLLFWILGAVFAAAFAWAIWAAPVFVEGSSSEPVGRQSAQSRGAKKEPLEEGVSP